MHLGGGSIVNPGWSNRVLPGRVRKAIDGDQGHEKWNERSSSPSTDNAGAGEEKRDPPEIVGCCQKGLAVANRMQSDVNDQTNDCGTARDRWYPNQTPA